MQERSSVRRWLAVAVVAVVVQQTLTEYPDPGPGPHLFWGGVSLLLLYLIYRGGGVARALFLALALFGVGVFVWAGGRDERDMALTLAYALQASVMLVPSVRGWARRKSAGPLTRPSAA